MTSAKGACIDRRTTNPRIGDPSVCLHQGRGSKVLVLVPPVRRARGRTTGAKNALVHAVELLTVFLRLDVFTLLGRVIVLQVGFNRLVLFVEMGEVRNQILDNVHWTRKVRYTRVEVVKPTNCAEAGKSCCPCLGFGQFGRDTQECSVR